MSKIVILLTGCVNPNGMPLTALTDTNVRAKQYYDAVQYYLSQTTVPVIFAENSNTRLDVPESERFEMLCFDGNKDKTHGKGYGECEIIDYALHNSRFISKDTTIIKITGRLFINNISTIIKITSLFKGKIQCTFHSDLSFADSRIFCCSSTFMKLLVHRKDGMNDSCGVFFEHILADCIKGQKETFIPFLVNPQIEGVSGSTGRCYKSIQDYSLKTHYQYLRFQLSIWRKINKL